MIVRAYFLMADPAGGTPRLVPVLRVVPKSAGTVRAALTALLAGPSAREAGASAEITTAIPADTKLLSVKLSGETATIDLSESFVSSHAMSVVRARLAEVVFTATQFTNVNLVWFLVEGRPIAEHGTSWYDFDAPLSRVIFRDDLLPGIFVDRPAWGAEYASGSRIFGLANVYEAQFRVALRAHDGTVLADQQVLAACGDGCWADFDVTIHYDVSKPQWGSLSVWDTSEADGTTIFRRDYPVFLRP